MKSGKKLCAWIVVFCMVMGAAGSAFGASQVWVTGSGQGDNKKSAFYQAAVDAVWKVLYKEIGEGADVNDELTEKVAEKLQSNFNYYIAKKKLRSVKEDDLLGGYEISADFLIKKKRIAKLASEIMTSSSSSKNGKKPTIMFLIKDNQLRAAFTQEFIKKGLVVISKEKSISEFKKAIAANDQKNKAWAKLSPNQQEEKKILHMLTGSGGEEMPAEKAIQLADFMKADFFVKGRYKITPKKEDSFGRKRVLLNLEELNVYNTRSGEILSTISDLIIASGDSIAEAEQVAVKKSALTLAEQSFEQMIKVFNRR